MKYLIYLTILAAVFSCGKVTPSKINGKWNATKISISSNNTYFPDTTLSSYSTLEFDGQHLYSFNDGSSGPTYDTTYNYMWSIQFEKNSDFVMTITGEFDQNSEIISYTTLFKGTWSLPGKEKVNDFKKGDRILFIIYEILEESINLNTGVSSNYNQVHSSLGYSKDDHLMFKVEELTKDKLILIRSSSWTEYNGQNIHQIDTHSGRWEFKKE